MQGMRHVVNFSLALALLVSCTGEPTDSESKRQTAIRGALSGSALLQLNVPGGTRERTVVLGGSASHLHPADEIVARSWRVPTASLDLWLTMLRQLRAKGTTFHLVNCGSDGRRDWLAAGHAPLGKSVVRGVASSDVGLQLFLTMQNHPAKVTVALHGTTGQGEGAFVLDPVSTTSPSTLVPQLVQPSCADPVRAAIR